MSTTEIHTIEWGTAQYKQELELRQNIMRLPIGLNIYDEDQAAEKGFHHFGAFRGEKLVGVLFLKPVDAFVSLVGGICVDAGWQKQGIGRLLMQHAECFLKKNGRHTLALHARVTAQGFYERLGYTLDSPSIFQEVGIPHVAMHKRL